MTGEGPGDVSAAADHELGRSGVRLNEVLDAVVGYHVLVPAHGHEAAGALDGVAVEGERAESALRRAVLTDQQLGADSGTQAVGRLDEAGERDGRSAGVGGVYLPGVVDVLVRVGTPGLLGRTWCRRILGRPRRRGLRSTRTRGTGRLRLAS